MLCCWIEDPNSLEFRLHIPRIYDYLWVAEDGMKMQVIFLCSSLYQFLFTFSLGDYFSGIRFLFSNTPRLAYHCIDRGKNIQSGVTVAYIRRRGRDTI